MSWKVRGIWRIGLRPRRILSKWGMRLRLRMELRNRPRFEWCLRLWILGHGLNGCGCESLYTRHKSCSIYECDDYTLHFRNLVPVQLGFPLEGSAECARSVPGRNRLQSHLEE